MIIFTHNACSYLGFGIVFIRSKVVFIILKYYMADSWVNYNDIITVIVSGEQNHINFRMLWYLVTRWRTTRNT